MDTPNPHTLILKQFPEVNISHHNVQTKFKAQAGFVRNIVELCPSQYIYHDKVMRDEPMEEFIENNGPYTHGIIVQVPNWRKNKISYSIECYTTKEVGYGLFFCYLCT